MVVSANRNQGPNGSGNFDAEAICLVCLATIVVALVLSALLASWAVTFGMGAIAVMAFVAGRRWL